MRLLDTETGQFVEKDPKESKLKYAILSHTWDSRGEQTYPELRKIQERCAPIYQLLQSRDSRDNSLSSVKQVL